MSTRITKRTVSRGEYIPLWKMTQARKRFKDYDWQAWEQATLRLRRNNYESEEDQMQDQAVHDQGKALITAESHDYGLREITHDAQREELLKVVKGMYSRDDLSDADLQVIVEVAKGNNINPAAPGAMFAYKRKKSVYEDGQWKKTEETVIGLGYQAYISIAHQQVEFIMKPSRAMTPEERATYSVGEGDVGVIVLAYRNKDLEQVAKMKTMGLDADWRDFAVVGVGKWRAQAYKDSKGNWKSDNVPETWDEYMVAENRAVKNLCRRLGIVTLVPAAPGARAITGDAEGADYVIGAGIQESTPSLPESIEAIEGEIADNEAPESTNGTTDHTPAPEAGEQPDTTPQEAPAVTPEGAGSVEAREQKQMYLGKIPVAICEARDAFIAAGHSTEKLDKNDLKRFHVEFSDFLKGHEDKSTVTKKSFIEWIFGYTTSADMTYADATAMRWWWHYPEWADLEYAAYAGKLALDAELNAGEGESEDTES